MSSEYIDDNIARSVKPYMKCGICKEVYREATTITICLHTFCRICIYQKISEEDNPCCPVCKIDLGCMPEKKIRPNHNLQGLAANIFPLKGSKAETPPVKRKEGSSSSLMESTPVSVQDGETSRKKESGVRKGSSTGSDILATEETPKTVEDSVEELLNGPSSPKTLNKVMQNQNQNSSAKSSNNQIGDELVEDNSKGLKGKVDSGKPLNTLVEDDSKSKFSEANMQGSSHVKAGASGSGDIDMKQMQIKDNEKKAKVQDGKSSMSSVPRTGKCTSGCGCSTRYQSSAPSQTSSSKVVVNESCQNRKDSPVWISLVASENPVGCEPLPQLSSTYMEIKDISMTISIVQSYLAKKLDLSSETEVEIKHLGEVLVPDLKLSSVLEASSSNKKVQVSASDSGKDFVIVLSYSRRVAASTSTT